MTADIMAAPELIGVLPAAVLGAAMTSHLALAGTPVDRTGLRRMGTARITGGWTPEQTIAEAAAASAADRDLPAAAWLPVWARIRRDPPHLTLTCHGRPILAFAGLRGLDGRPLLAAGSDDGSVQLWEAETGAVTMPGSLPPGGRVFDLAALDRPRGSALILARDGEPVLIRSLDEHVSDVRLGAHSAEVRAVLALDVPDLGPVVITGDVTGVVRRWDPGSGRAVGAAMTGHTGPVHTIVPVRIADRVLVASAGHDGTIRFWDPGDQRLVRRFAVAHTRPVRAMAVTRLDVGTTVLVSGDDAGVVRRWDAATGRPIGEPLEYRCRITAITTWAGLAGVLMVCADEFGRLHFWEPAAGRPLGQPVTVHDGAVLRLLTIPSGAGGYHREEPRTRLATAGEDGTIRIWQHTQLLAVAQQPDRPAGDPEHAAWPDRLRSARDGTRTVLTALGPENTARHWDWSTGAPVAGAENPASTDEDAEWVLPVPDGRMVRVTTEPGHTFITGLTYGTAKPVAVPGRASAAALITGPGNSVRVALAGRDAAVSIVREIGAEWIVERRLLGHQQAVTALAVLTGGRDELLLSASDDRTIRVWSPDNDVARHVIPLGTRIRAMTAVGDEVAIAADDGLMVIRLLPDWITNRGKG